MKKFEVHSPTWNQRYISKPSNMSMIYSRIKLEEISCATKLKILSQKPTEDNFQNDLNPEKWLSSITAALHTARSPIASTEKSFNYEISHLYAFIYQNGCHKKEKFIQAFKKVGKCLKRWNEIELSDLFSDVLDMIPKEFLYIRSIRLPSTQCMYYLLQRVVASFHLLMQCNSYCMEAAVYFRSKIVQGHFIATATLGYAITGRIRALCLHLIGLLAEANDDLHPYVMAMIQIYQIDDVEPLPHNLKEELTSFVNKSGKKINKTKRDKSRETKKHLRRMENESKNFIIPIESLPSCSQDEAYQNEDSPVSGEDVAGNESEMETDGSVNGGSDGFSFSIPIREDDDIGEHITHSKFETLKKLSVNVIQTHDEKNSSAERANGKQLLSKKKKKNRKRGLSNDDTYAKNLPDKTSERNIETIVKGTESTSVHKKCFTTDKKRKSVSDVSMIGNGEEPNANVLSDFCRISAGRYFTHDSIGEKTLNKNRKRKRKGKK